MLAAITETDNVLLDLRYATPDNLSGLPVYTRPVALLLPEARRRLLKEGRMAAFIRAAPPST